MFLEILVRQSNLHTLNFHSQLQALQEDLIWFGKIFHRHILSIL